MKMCKLRRTLRVKVEIAAWRWFGATSLASYLGISDFKIDGVRV